MAHVTYGKSDKRYLILLTKENQMIDKLKALTHSRRFWIAVSGFVFVLFDGLGLPLTEDQVNNLVLVGGAWIVGDSIRKS